MPIGAFARLSDRLLAHLGSEAVLHGAPTRHPVNVVHGVDFADANDQVAFSRSVATIHKEDMPRGGDKLQADGGRFVLDTLLKDNGYTEQWIIRGDV